ncbi:terminase [Bordetella hinzii]|uniref:terminase small subunit-like protein n=1 Tax=Bordetella hinzii TaxID=103855 RepID=UPI0013EFD1A2|nr:terminase [Bordetella hinzii]QII84185.1 terminase [Bordetella hinzii]
MAITNDNREQRQGIFLRALRDGQTFSRALAQAGIASRATINAWREKDADFAAAFNEAMEHAADLLEAEARRRAVDGVDEPHFYKDEVVGHVRKYSDTLLLALLKATRPEKFKERVEHSGQVEVNLAERLARGRARTGAGND